MLAGGIKRIGKQYALQLRVCVIIISLARPTNPEGSDEDAVLRTRAQHSKLLFSLPLRISFYPPSTGNVTARVWEQRQVVGQTTATGDRIGRIKRNVFCKRRVFGTRNADRVSMESSDEKKIPVANAIVQIIFLTHSSP